MQTLILLHGALGSAAQLQPLADILQKEYKIHTLSFSGHGDEPMKAAGFSIQEFAAEVLQMMDENAITEAAIFGYSMGGYVALYLAKHYPERISKVITLATKFHWNEATATKEVKMLDAATIAAKVPAYAKVLEERHTALGWEKVLEQTVDMMLSLGRDNALGMRDYASIAIPSLIILGDRDKMVTLQETVDIYNALPNAQLGILPATPHPLEQVDVQLLSYFIRRFI